MLRDELRLELHYGVFNASSWQIFNLSLGERRRGIASSVSSAAMLTSLHVEGHRAVPLACSLLLIVIGILSIGALTHLTAAFLMRIGCD